MFTMSYYIMDKSKMFSDFPNSITKNPVVLGVQVHSTFFYICPYSFPPKLIFIKTSMNISYRSECILLPFTPIFRIL